MSSLLCFICHSTVTHDTNEETREKYREVIGLNLCPDSHLCYICCHILNKFTLFRSICLKRSLEYPVLFSEQSTLNLQRSEVEIHIQCPDETCQEVSSGNCYIINYDVEINDDNNSYHNKNQQYAKFEEDHDYLNPDFEINPHIDKCSDTAYEINENNKLDGASVLNESNLCDIGYPFLQDYDDRYDDQNANEESPRNNEIDDKIDETTNEIHEEEVNTEDAKVDEKKNKSKKIKKGFEKIVLSLEEQKAELEANRKAKKYIEAEFKCFNCAAGFLFKDTYQAHMMRHEESNGEHRCDLCTLRFATPAVLRSHTALHSERYRCAVCTTLMGPRARARHLCYRGSGSEEVACHLCAGMFRDSSGLQQHLRRVHRSRTSRLYPCAVCGEQCRDQAAVRTHMLKHLKKRFACDLCSSVYSSPYTLNRHKRSHEVIEERHFCSCGLSYATRKSLLAHKRNSLAHQQTVFECGKCPRVLPHRRALEAHDRKVHTDRRTEKPKYIRKNVERVVCQVCGKSFKGNSKLNRHLREVCEKAKMEEQCT